MGFAVKGMCGESQIDGWVEPTTDATDFLAFKHIQGHDTKT